MFSRTACSDLSEETTSLELGALHMRRKLKAASIVVSLLMLPSVASLAAPAHNYPLTGKVLETSAGRANEHTYKVETDASIYKLLCYRHVVMVTLYAECAVNSKPLATGDEVHLRTDGKTIFLDAGNDKEQPLSILLEEAKILPLLPTPAGAAGEGAVVLARGRELSNEVAVQSFPSPPPPAPASTSNSIPAGPVIVIPSTGGSPVLVAPTSPAAGGVVTGVNTATGQPVVGIAASPISSPSPPPAPAFNTAAVSSSGPAWMEVIYLETDSRIYQLACLTKNCALAGHTLSLGDPLLVRIAGKWAYISSASANGKSKEGKFRILSITGTDEAPSSLPL
jgi:hypothetical protein